MNVEPIVESLAEQAIDWLVLLRSGNVNARQRQQFELWLQQDPKHRAAYADAETLWRSAAQVLSETRVAKPQSKAVKTAPSQYPIIRQQRLPGLAAAASLLLFVWLGWSTYGDRWLSDYSTQAGEQKQVSFADGSSALLNTGTAIAVEWTDNQRTIILRKGQAEFKVAPDPNRPFVVIAGKTSVQALGTAFEVYLEASGEVDITVSEHAVNVGLENSPNGMVEVTEGEQLAYPGQGELPQPKQVNINQSKAWQRGKLIFRDRLLAEVVAELNRYTKARIILPNRTVGKMRVSGVFPINTLAVLNDLKQVFPIQVLHLGPWLVILYS
jgi:transmembrane sensor